MVHFFGDFGRGVVLFYGPFVWGYGPSFWSMGRCLGLWAFVLVYVPLFRSMGLRSALCPVISIYVPYVPSSRSMDRRPHSMCRPPTAIHCTTSANHRTPTKKGSI